MFLANLRRIWSAILWYLFCDLILFWKSLISKLLALPRILTGCWVLNILEVGGLTQPGLSITTSPPNMVFQGVRSMGSSGMYPRSPGFFWLVSCYAALVSHWSRGESAGCHCLPGSCCTHATLHLSYYQYSPYSSHDWWFSGFCCKDLKSYFFSQIFIVLAEEQSILNNAMFFNAFAMSYWLLE